MKTLLYIIGACTIISAASCGGNSSAPDNPPSSFNKPAVSDSIYQYATPVDSTTGSGAGANASYHKTDSTGK